MKSWSICFSGMTRPSVSFTPGETTLTETRSLKQLLPEFPGISLEKVELLTNRSSSRKEGVAMIPTLVAGEHRLTGFYLTKKRIRQFLESLA